MWESFAGWGCVTHAPNAQTSSRLRRVCRPPTPSTCVALLGSAGLKHVVNQNCIYTCTGQRPFVATPTRQFTAEHPLPSRSLSVAVQSNWLASVARACCRLAAAMSPMAWPTSGKRGGHTERERDRESDARSCGKDRDGRRRRTEDREQRKEADAAHGGPSTMHV